MDDIFRYYKGFGIAHDSIDAVNSIIEELSETYIEPNDFIHMPVSNEDIDTILDVVLWVCMSNEYSSGEIESFKWKSD